MRRVCILARVAEMGVMPGVRECGESVSKVLRGVCVRQSCVREERVRSQNAHENAPVAHMSSMVCCQL